MTHHDLRLVRMNPIDRTLHCQRHGLLTKSETFDVWLRSNVDTTKAAETQARWGRLAGFIDVLVRVFSRPRCEP